MTRFLGAFLMASLLAPLANAQTLTIELEAELDEAPPPPSAGAVVVVRPEGDARLAMPAEPPPLVYTTPSSEPAPVSDAESSGLELWGGLALNVEGMDLSGLSLDLGDPEVGALAGLSLDQAWAGRASMREVITGGVALHVGMRAMGFLRGPELRLALGGGEIDGEAMPIAVDGFQLAAQSMFYLRAELAFGLQIPLGIVTPYVVAIGSAGVAFVDVAVTEARLGGLGSETIEAGLFGAGLEAGIDVEVEDGIALGFAFRGNFVGAPSLGGAFRVSWGGE